MHKKIILSLFLISMSIISSAQFVAEPIFSEGDQITVEIIPGRGLFYNHSISRGQTIYSLARTFQVRPVEIIAINDLHPGIPISLGQTISVPFDHDLLYKGLSVDNFDSGLFIPVFYTTRPKDNIYRISKVFFKQSVEVMMRRNRMENLSLSIGQKLLVGWLPVDEEVSRYKRKIIIQEPVIYSEIDEDISPDTLILEDDEDTPFYSDIDSTEEIEILYDERAIAIWDKTAPDKENLFALHRSARINSIIELYNPLTKRKAFAKVIARIPKGTYPDDVNILISPRVANSLGALDSRFMVELKFYE